MISDAMVFKRNTLISVLMMCLYFDDANHRLTFVFWPAVNLYSRPVCEGALP